MIGILSTWSFSEDYESEREIVSFNFRSSYGLVTTGILSNFSSFSDSGSERGLVSVTFGSSCGSVTIGVRSIP
jgi:hypothetical protein